jgi:phosphoribosylamine--glycine ligase
LSAAAGANTALSWKLASERAFPTLFALPETRASRHLRAMRPADAADPHALVAIARREGVDSRSLVPSCHSAAASLTCFADEGLLLFGPSQRAARLESSKVFAKEFMERNRRANGALQSVRLRGGRAGCTTQP